MDGVDSSILVVDDDVEIRELISDYLADHEGYKVITAENGRKALELLKRKKIDLVLSDINMPEMKGFDLLKEIKEKHPKIKRVLITAYNVEDYLELALKHDIGNIFVKTTPFNFQELSAILSRLLRNDIFGLHNYFSGTTELVLYKIRDSKTLENDAEKIVRIIGDSERSKRLELVIVEILTNAIFYGVRNESGNEKERWNANVTLSDDRAIIVSVAKDAEKYAISVTDDGGRLKKSDVLYWLNRQISKDDRGLPLGVFDTHGRGLFIARKYIDRLIVNIDQDRRTEVIIINYFKDTYKGYKPLYINEI
jgi:CheY-like chemotaxis protein/anti-sigma regulatory factor (Ser/Thr protein kinase)